MADIKNETTSDCHEGCWQCKGERSREQGGAGNQRHVVNQGCKGDPSLPLPLPAPPEKCSCSYILCVFVGVNNTSTLSGYSGGCKEGVAGTCHMMAAQINCNYLVHAFRPRTPPSPCIPFCILNPLWENVSSKNFVVNSKWHWPLLLHSLCECVYE